jgi:hypothetical protein
MLLCKTTCPTACCVPGCRYGANIETIKTVLQHQCLPERVEVQGQDSVQSFAEAPAWFRRAHQLQQLEQMDQQQRPDQ